jgi:hypothetical protein
MNTLYEILLTSHSIIRWLVLLLGLFAIIRASTGMSFRRPWEKMDDRAGLLFTIAFDIQVLIGLVLYFFVSPITRSLLQGGANAMADPATRFFGAEHIAIMIVALALAHVGRSLSRGAGKRFMNTVDRKVKEVERKKAHRSAVLFYALSLVVILLGIPWPFLANIGRPLF